MKIMKYVDKFAFSLLIIVYSSKRSSATACGKPGRSRKSWPFNAEGREIFEEGFKAHYRCQHVPVSQFDRTCVDGKWSGSIPKCVELLNATGLSVRASSPITVHFTWKNEMRVVGVQFALRRPGNVSIWPVMDVRGVIGLSSTLKLKVLASNNQDIILVRITSTSPDVRYLEEQAKLTVRTKNYVADCTVNAEGQWVQLHTNIEGPYLCIVQDKYGLYHINETVEDCQTPDTPLHAILESTFRSENALSAVFSCIEGYRLKPLWQSPTCEENGDWTLYDFQPCEEVFCDKDETDLEIVSLDRSATSGFRFPVGTKAVLSCSTVKDKRYVVCSKNGTWLPKTELCETSFFRAENLVIGLALSLVCVVICMLITFFWLYCRLQPVSPVTANYSGYNDVFQNEPANYECIRLEPRETNITA